MNHKEKLLNSCRISSQLKNYISAIDLIKMKTSGKSLQHLIPDMLLASDSDTSEVVKIFCDYLSEENIIDFCGEIKYIYIKLDGRALSDSNIYLKINDLLSLAGGFRGNFKGVICIEIQFLKYLSREFSDTLKYIKTITDNCFRLIICNKRHADNVAKLLHSAAYRIQIIKDDDLSLKGLTEFFTEKLNENNLTLDNKAIGNLESILYELIKLHKITNWEEADALFCDMLFYILICGKNRSLSDIINNYYKEQILADKIKKEEKNNIGFTRGI